MIALVPFIMIWEVYWAVMWCSQIVEICYMQVDVTDIVKGHSSYLEKAGEIVQALDIDSFYPHHNDKLQQPAELWHMTLNLCAA